MRGHLTKDVLLTSFRLSTSCQLSYRIQNLILTILDSNRQAGAHQILKATEIQNRPADPLTASLVGKIKFNRRKIFLVTNFGYRVCMCKSFTDGQLRKIDESGQPGDEQFQFNISNDHQECQAHYEVLGAAITDYIYHLLEKEGLYRLPVPKGSTEMDGTFIFVSKDYDKKDVLLVLIHGSGAVRAGQWARSLIINDSLDAGTQIPYIREAQKRGYGVMVLNCNDNYREDKKIKHSSTAEEHTMYTWNTYITNTKAASIAIVAHSYGGVLTVMLADKQKKQFENRVKAVALTDSVHGFSGAKISKHLKRISRNWISSSSPLDAPMKTPEFDIMRVSAGHPKHEMTSCKCIDSVFTFFEEKLKA